MDAFIPQINALVAENEIDNIEVKILAMENLIHEILTVDMTENINLIYGQMLCQYLASSYTEGTQFLNFHETSATPIGNKFAPPANVAELTERVIYLMMLKRFLVFSVTHRFIAYLYTVDHFTTDVETVFVARNNPGVESTFSWSFDDHGYATFMGAEVDNMNIIVPLNSRFLVPRMT